MTLATLSLLALLLALLATVGLLSQLWMSGQDDQSGVGPWARTTPFEPIGKPPSDYVSLRWGEKHQFSRTENEWSRLVAKLDGFEIALGGDPEQQPAPPSFSEPWLMQRLSDLEALAGNLPGSSDRHESTALPTELPTELATEKKNA